MKSSFLLLAVLLLTGFGCVQKPVIPTNTLPPEPAPAPQAMMDVKVALIDIHHTVTGVKKIGCDDGVVFITKQVPETQSTLTAALQQLFALGTENVKDPKTGVELYNIVARIQAWGAPQGKALAFERATVTSGTARIYLTGDLGGFGGVCDDPRLAAQIEETAKQFGTVTKVEFYLNGTKTTLIPNMKG